MISLAGLADLHDRHRADLELPIPSVEVGDVTIGGETPVLMGTLNLSRDSSYRESVATSLTSAVRKARVDVANGAGIIDVGAESSHIGTVRRSAGAQIAELVPVVRALVDDGICVSVETYEPTVVRACLEAGAAMLNMTGREHEEEMLTLAAEFDAGVVLCFGEVGNVREVSDLPLGADPAPFLLDHFGPRVEKARDLGASRLLVDPGMGFYYGNLVDPIPRARHQARVLAQCFRLRPLGVPVCNALPHAFDLFEEEFRTAESFFAVLALLGGTQLLRTHEVLRVRAVTEAMSVLAVDGGSPPA